MTGTETIWLLVDRRALNERRKFSIEMFVDRTERENCFGRRSFDLGRMNSWRSKKDFSRDEKEENSFCRRIRRKRRSKRGSIRRFSSFNQFGAKTDKTKEERRSSMKRREVLRFFVLLLLFRRFDATFRQAEKCSKRKIDFSQWEKLKIRFFFCFQFFSVRRRTASCRDQRFAAKLIESKERWSSLCLFRAMEIIWRTKIVRSLSKFDCFSFSTRWKSVSFRF